MKVLLIVVAFLNSVSAFAIPPDTRFDSPERLPNTDHKNRCASSLMEIKGHIHVIFSPNGKDILLKTESAPLRLIDRATLRIMTEIDTGGAPGTIEWSPNSDKFLVINSSLRDRALVYSRKTLKPIVELDFFGSSGIKTNDIHAFYLATTHWSATGKYVARRGRVLSIANAETGRFVSMYGSNKDLDFDNQIVSFRWHPVHEEVLAISYGDGSVRFEGLENTRKALVRKQYPIKRPSFLNKLNGSARSVGAFFLGEWSPDGDLIPVIRLLDKSSRFEVRVLNLSGEVVSIFEGQLKHKRGYSPVANRFNFEWSADSWQFVLTHTDYAEAFNWNRESQKAVKTTKLKVSFGAQYANSSQPSIWIGPNGEKLLYAVKEGTLYLANAQGQIAQIDVSSEVIHIDRVITTVVEVFGISSENKIILKVTTRPDGRSRFIELPVVFLNSSKALFERGLDLNAFLR